MSKVNVLDNLEKQQALIIMDWAMKWLPKRYREAQTDWFGKKGLSWHVSACITRAESQELEFEVMNSISLEFYYYYTDDDDDELYFHHNDNLPFKALIRISFAFHC